MRCSFEDGFHLVVVERGYDRSHQDTGRNPGSAQGRKRPQPRLRRGGARLEGALQLVEIGRAHAELQSRLHLVCRLLLEKKKKKHIITTYKSMRMQYSRCQAVTW